MSSKAFYSTILAGALVWVGVGVVETTHAATINWTLDTGGTNTGVAFGNVRTFNSTPAGNTLQAAAYSVTTTGGTLSTAYLGQYSGGGLGTNNRGEVAVAGDAPPNDHTVDNGGTDARFDMVIFQFPQDNYDAVSAFLTQFDIAPVGNADSDVSYWVGGTLAALPNVGGASSSFTGKTMSQLETTYGFTRHDVAHNSSGNVLFNQGTTEPEGGRYVIVAASFSLSTGNDSFKIKTLAGNTPPPPQNGAVPEPSTILLLGSGLAGLAIWAKRKNQKV